MQIENGYAKDFIEIAGNVDGVDEYRQISFHLDNILVISPGAFDEDLGDFETMIEMEHRVLVVRFSYRKFSDLYQDYMSMSRVRVGTGNITLN